MNFKVSVIVFCASLSLTDVAPASCSSRQRGPARNLNAATPAEAMPQPPPAEGKEVKVLAEGQYGKVEKPFLVVAREAEVYGELRSLVEGLPDLGANFFRQNAVVAAFAGTRPSGGYSVEIKRGADGLVHVKETPPPEGAIVTMALTQPYKVVSLEVSEERGVELDLSGPWDATHWRPYRVASGEFKTGGGIAGRFEELTLAGDLKVARHGKLVTVLFDLKGAGARTGRGLRGAATGLERAADRFEIPRVDAGTLVDHPRSPLRAAGQFSDGGGKLSLTFDSVPSNINDGYSGMGKLEATATGPAPPKS